MKRTLLLLVVIVVLSAGLVGAWYFVSSKVDQTINEAQLRMQSQGRVIECSERTLTGFPFRISINCIRTGYSDDLSGFAFRAGELRSASQLYQPGKAVVELDGPASINLPTAGAADLNWQSMRASIKAGLSGAERFSIMGENIELMPRAGSIEAFAAKGLQVHGRQVGDNDIQLALSALQLASPFDRWPQFDFSTTMRLKDSKDYLSKQPDLRKLAQERGLDGEINLLRYQPESGGEIEIKGPFQVSQSGLLSGEFDISAKEFSRLIAALGRAFPNNQNDVQQLVQLGAMIDANSGKPAQFKLKVRGGKVAFGFIPLGKIPPLF